MRKYRVHRAAGNGIVESRSVGCLFGIDQDEKFHWDVVGPQFLTHQLWEEHYLLTTNIDALAERVAP